MAVKTYKDPLEIRHYGEAIARYAEGMKAIASARDNVLSKKRDHAENLAGTGPYNDLSESLVDYIIFGPEKSKAAAMRKKEGLFGAFYFVHKPELEMSLKAPTLLGEAGFTLQTTLDGKQVNIPLQDVDFWFVPRVREAFTNKLLKFGGIVISKDVECVDAYGGKHLLAGGTEITNLDREPNAWAMDRSGNKLFKIVDKEGRELIPKCAIKMLWGKVGAQGFKKYGAGTIEFETLNRDGVDDDVTAETHVINLLYELQDNHHLDLMPQFNAYVQAARDSLQHRPDLLEAMAVGVEMGHSASRHLHEIPRDAHYLMLPHARGRNNLGQLEAAGKAMEEVASILDIFLPPVREDARFKPLFEDVEAASKSYLNLYKREYQYKTAQFWQDIKADAASWQRYPDVFDAAWLNGAGQHGTIKSSTLVHSRLPSVFLDDPATKERIEKIFFSESKRKAVQEVRSALGQMADYFGSAQQFTDAPQTYEFDASCVDVNAARNVMSQAAGALRKTANDFRFGHLTKSELEKVVSKVAAASEMMDVMVEAGVKPKPSTSKHNKNFGFQIKTWEGMKPSFDNFLTMMQAVKCDPQRWMELYTKVSLAKKVEHQDNPRSIANAELTDALVEESPNNTVSDIDHIPPVKDNILRK